MGCGFESVLERVGKCGQSTLGAGSAVVKLVPSLSVTAAIVQLGSKAMGGLIPSMSSSYVAPAVYRTRGGSSLALNDIARRWASICLYLSGRTTLV